jgi:putative transcriptional regulator
MKKQEEGYEGSISKDIVKKELLKNGLLFFLILSGSAAFTIFILMMISIDEKFTVPMELNIMLILFILVIPLVVILILTAVYESAYVRNFFYEITGDNIILHHGVLTKTRATIPYSRIQNINIVNGVFDRMFKTFTVKIETAGGSAMAASAQSGRARPEGYIPGLKNPHFIEEKIKEMINKYSAIPSGLEDKIFKPEELAFDNFISYIISKMRTSDKLQTSIKELREKANMTTAQLADKVEVPVHTIEHLEEGTYDPSLALAYRIAKVLGKSIEELFKL